jgi:hypothetical protein
MLFWLRAKHHSLGSVCCMAERCRVWSALSDGQTVQMAMVGCDGIAGGAVALGLHARSQQSASAACNAFTRSRRDRRAGCPAERHLHDSEALPLTQAARAPPSDVRPNTTPSGPDISNLSERGAERGGLHVNKHKGAARHRREHISPQNVLVNDRRRPHPEVIFTCIVAGDPGRPVLPFLGRRWLWIRSLVHPMDFYRH